MKEFKGTKGKLSFSPQKGIKGHCIQAQIWSSKKEEYVAFMSATVDEEEANANAKLFASSKELLYSLQKILANFKSCINGGATESITDKIDIAVAELIIKKLTE